MRRAIILVTLAMMVLSPAASSLRAQAPSGNARVVDRVAAWVEDDIILESELRELSLYQQLLGEKSSGNDALFQRVIEQWLVAREAAAARFPRPAEAEVDQAADRIEKLFPSKEAYRERLAELGLDSAAVRRMAQRQLLFARYIDYKFRPAAQVDNAAIEKYFREQLVPQLTARGQSAPGLDAVSDQIRELLTQQQISERAAQWLDDARSRLKIEMAGKQDGR